MTNNTQRPLGAPLGVVNDPHQVTRPRDFFVDQPLQWNTSQDARGVFEVPEIDPSILEEIRRQLTRSTTSRASTHITSAEKPKTLPKEAIPLFLELVRAERERCLLIQDVDERDTALGNLVDCDSRVFDRLKSSVITYWAIFG